MGGALEQDAKISLAGDLVDALGGRAAEGKDGDKIHVAVVRGEDRLALDAQGAKMRCDVGGLRDLVQRVGVALAVKVHAVFVADGVELVQAQEEAAALRGDLYRAANEIDELKNKLAELHETKTEQPAEQKPEPKTAAEIIAARWADVDGLTATIKGATTAAPVVWLAGDTKPHEKEIEAAGGKWSGKKNAYYFRVA